MDQGIVSPTTAGHYVRLALVFFASVLGLLVLGFIFGSSSASADDGGPDDGGLVPAVAELAGGVVETVAPVTAQVTEAIPLVDVPLSPAATTLDTVTEIAPVVGDVLGATPAGVVVGTLVKTVDEVVETTVGTLTEIVGPVLQAVPVLPIAAAEAVASGIDGVVTVVSGDALGMWLNLTWPVGTGDIGTSSGALSTLTLPAAALGAGFLVLLFSRRLRLVDSALPVSPVYETDTSPD